MTPTEALLRRRQYIMSESSPGINWLLVPFTIIARENCQISMFLDEQGTVNYVRASINGGAITDIYQEIKTNGYVTLNAGDEMQLYSGDWHKSIYFGDFGAGTDYGTFDVAGNIMSLHYGEDFINHADPEDISTGYDSGCLGYQDMFYNCTNIINAENLVIPYTISISSDSYANGAFTGCTNLLTPPKLPSTHLVSRAYYKMFYGCTSLSVAPELPATTLSINCYNSMFYNCSSLAVAPELPATTLANNCYSSMFTFCTSLTEAPLLPATSLVQGCYTSLFNGCSNLNYIKAMFTTDPNVIIGRQKPCYGWVQGVSRNGTFVKNANATWTLTGNNGIPTNWTVITEQP